MKHMLKGILTQFGMERSHLNAQFAIKAFMKHILKGILIQFTKERSHFNAKFAIKAFMKHILKGMSKSQRRDAFIKQKF